MILAIDIGNTRTKLAVFDDGEMRESRIFETENIRVGLNDCRPFLKTYGHFRIGWISTAQKFKLSSMKLWESFNPPPEMMHIHSMAKLPIVNKYASPATLGTDRIVSVIAALETAGGGPVLVIDAGTAITYDIANEKGEYLGGGISPGIDMRFKALHAFTARLPLIEDRKPSKLIGDDTKNAIRSGVLNGVTAEVQGIIERYKLRFGPELKVFLTGGNLGFFENQLKSINFADALLILKGIEVIVRKQSGQ